MAEAAVIGATASNYQGDVGLGGGTFGFFKLDLRPLEDLARYTMLYNREEYLQRQKDAESIAKEISESTSYDLTSGIDKDRKYLTQKYDELINYIRENPTALDYRNKEQWLKYKTMRNNLANDIASGKIRNTMYMLRQNEIQNTTEPGLKIQLQKDLNDEIAATDIKTPLKNTQQFDLTPIAVSEAPLTTIYTTDIGNNFFRTSNVDVINMQAARNLANAATTGLSDITDYESLPQYQALRTDEERNIFKQQYEQSAASGKLVQIESAKRWNEALQQYQNDPKFQNQDGTLNLESLIKNGKGFISKMASNIKAFNDSMKQMRDYIRNGYFKNNKGAVLEFGVDEDQVSEGDYKDIDLSDGLQPEEIVLMEMIAKKQLLSNQQQKVTATGFGIDRERSWLSYRASLQRQENKEVKTITDAAINFGNHIMRLKDRFQNSGVNSFSVAIKAVDETTRKAIGVEQQKDKDDRILEQRVVYKNDGSFSIQKFNGTPGEYDEFKRIEAKDENKWTDTEKEDYSDLLRKWEQYKQGDIEMVKQGFVDEVKSGMSKSGTQTGNFLRESQAGFSQIFGGRITGKSIFDDWNSMFGQKQPSNQQSGQVISIEQYKKMSLAERDAFIKGGGRYQ